MEPTSGHSRGLNPLPASAEVVGGFLAAFGKRPSTLGRLAAIRHFHRAAKEASPTSEESVKAVLAGIRRTVGAAPVRKKAATSDIVIAMAAEAKSLRGLRNRALLLLGFAGAFRRSVVALNVEEPRRDARGPVGHHSARQDRPGGARPPRGDLACPVEAVKAWREPAGSWRAPCSAGCGIGAHSALAPSGSRRA
jgi:hypothetical protein